MGARTVEHEGSNQLSLGLKFSDQQGIVPEQKEPLAVITSIGISFMTPDGETIIGKPSTNNGIDLVHIPCPEGMDTQAAILEKCAEWYTPEPKTFRDFGVLYHVQNPLQVHALIGVELSLSAMKAFAKQKRELRYYSYGLVLMEPEIEERDSLSKEIFGLHRHALIWDGSPSGMREEALKIPVVRQSGWRYKAPTFVKS